MEATTLDPVQFRAAQQSQWNTAASGWRKWSDLIDSRSGHISQRLVELAGVEPGSRVLDVAAGYGEPSLTAARVVGDGGTVVASDISAEMLAYGRERAEAAGLSNIEFVESEAASLELPEQSFDAAVSRWGIIFEPNGEEVAGRVRGFLKPGARMAISSWGPPERVPMLALAMGTAMRRLELPPPPPGTPGPLSRPTPDALGGLLQGGGFSDVQVEEDEVVLQWDSAEDYATFVKEIAPPVSAVIDPYPPEVQEEVWSLITEAARQHAGEDGSVTLSNLVLMASGSA